MLANIRQTNRVVNPYGGVVFCTAEIHQQGLAKLFDRSFEPRVKQAKFKYSDVILGWINSMLCGSQRLEDTKRHKSYFNEIPDIKHPSPDSIARIFKKLATESIHYQNGKVMHEFNINILLNELLVDTALQLGQINKQKDNILDVDQVIIPTEKYDSQKTYKKCDGYCPSVSFLNGGRTPVYIEGRNGNSSPDYRLKETLERTIGLLKSKGIKIHRFRSDNAAYSQQVITYLDSKGIEFFIRAQNSRSIFKVFKIPNQKWEDVWIDSKPWKAASIDYEFGKRTYRVVITKGSDSRRKKINKYTGDYDTCRAIITNCRSMTNQDVVSFYNKRAITELSFTSLLNDWNYKRLPFSYLNQNTVFMIMGAIGSVIYRHLRTNFSKKLPFVKSNYRLKNFIFHFVTVAMEWIVVGEARIPELNTDRNYSPLWGRPPSE